MHDDDDDDKETIIITVTVGPFPVLLTVGSSCRDKR
jgi:hypothetical protein